MQRKGSQKKTKFEKMKVTELNDELRKNYLSVTGLKIELIQQLAEVFSIRNNDEDIKTVDVSDHQGITEALVLL